MEAGRDTEHPGKKAKKYCSRGHPVWIDWNGDSSFSCDGCPGRIQPYAKYAECRRCPDVWWRQRDAHASMPTGTQSFWFCSYCVNRMESKIVEDNSANVRIVPKPARGYWQGDTR